MCLKTVFVTAKTSKGKIASKTGKLKGVGFKVLNLDRASPVMEIPFPKGK